MSSHILEKSPIALMYSRIVEGVTESNRSFMFLTSKYSLRTALCETIRYQDKSEHAPQTFIDTCTYDHQWARLFLEARKIIRQVSHGQYLLFGTPRPGPWTMPAWRKRPRWSESRKCGRKFTAKPKSLCKYSTNDQLNFELYGIGKCFDIETF